MKLSVLLTYLFMVLLLVTNCSSTKEEGSKKEVEEKKPATGEKPQYIISITHDGKTVGDITIELYPDIAPKTCQNFDSLVAVKFYDGTAFHRVIPGFMIQGGDPNSKSKPKSTWGIGDPGQTKVPAEFNSIKHERGVLSMARTPDPNSATSQFFIMHAESSHLDGQYTAFGRVLTGLELVDKICGLPREGEKPINKIEMKIRKK